MCYSVTLCGWNTYSKIFFQKISMFKAPFFGVNGKKHDCFESLKSINGDYTAIYKLL